MAMRPWPRMTLVKRGFKFVNRSSWPEIAACPVFLTYATLGTLKQAVDRVEQYYYKPEMLATISSQYVAGWAEFTYECWCECPEIFRQQMRPAIADLCARALIGMPF